MYGFGAWGAAYRFRGRWFHGFWTGFSDGFWAGFSDGFWAGFSDGLRARVSTEGFGGGFSDGLGARLPLGGRQAFGRRRPHLDLLDLDARRVRDALLDVLYSVHLMFSQSYSVCQGLYRQELLFGVNWWFPTQTAAGVSGFLQICPTPKYYFAWIHQN